MRRRSRAPQDRSAAQGGSCGGSSTLPPAAAAACAAMRARRAVSDVQSAGRALPTPPGLSATVSGPSEVGPRGRAARLGAVCPRCRCWPRAAPAVEIDACAVGSANRHVSSAAPLPPPPAAARRPPDCKSRPWCSSVRRRPRAAGSCSQTQARAPRPSAGQAEAAARLQSAPHRAQRYAAGRL